MIVRDLPFVLDLFRVELGGEVLDFLFLLIENFKFLGLLVVVLLLLALEFVRDVANVLLVLFVHFANFADLLLLLLDFGIVLLNAVH